MGAQPRDDELDRWREEISSASVPIDLVPNLRDGNQPRVSALTTGSLGSLNVFEVAGSAVDVHRTRAAIRRHDPGLVKVAVQLRGRGLLAHRDQKAVLAPGDFIVYDTSEPYLLHLENDYSLFVVVFPRTALKMSANGISSITAIPMRADHGVGALVSPFLSGLRQGLSSGSLTPNPRFEEAVIDLICASVTDHASQTNGAPGATILASAKSFIDRHHADPALDTSMVAAVTTSEIQPCCGTASAPSAHVMDTSTPRISREFSNRDTGCRHGRFVNRRCGRLTSPLALNLSTGSKPPPHTS